MRAILRRFWHSPAFWQGLSTGSALGGVIGGSVFLTVAAWKHYPFCISLGLVLVIASGLIPFLGNAPASS